MAPLREAFFLGTGADRRFCLLTRPEGAVLGAIVYLHPFAEELNRSRRMVSLAAMAFARQGWMVMQMDAHGCGDSEGDFGDASWDSWLADIDRARTWLAERSNGPTVLWTLRTGGLLAASWIATRQMALPLLAWQPVLNGKQYLTQFLRIRLGADLAQSSEARTVLASLRASLKAGEAASIGGYWLSPTLADDLESAAFKLPPAYGAPVTVLEVSSLDPAELTPALDNWVNTARQDGVACDANAVAGQKFWQSQEIETAMALIPASLAALKGWAAS